MTKEGPMIRNPVRLTLSLLAALALVALPAASHLAAQGSKGTIKIATQSPLSGGQAALGEGIKLGAQLAIEKWRGNLTDRKSTRLNSSHANISYAVFCLK